jgi:hypothetical protein
MLTALMLAAALAAPPAWPKDVETYRGNVEGCIHWAGEPGWDAAREKQINAAVKQTCGAAKRDYPRLMKKYRRSPKVLAEIGRIKAELTDAGL